MHRKLLPYAYFMAPAKESAADFNLDQDPAEAKGDMSQLGDEPEGDRGDDFDPSLFEENDDAPRKPVPDEKNKGEKGEKGEKDDAAGDKDDAAGDKDDVVDEEKAEKDKEAEKPAKPEKTKPNRADKRVQQLLERTAALERQLAAKTGSEAVATTLADLEAESVRLEKDYAKALTEDPEKAVSLMRDIRRVDREIARVEATAAAEAQVTERLEQRDLNVAIAEITEKYPELEKGHEDFDQETVNEINAVYSGLLSTSSSKAAAMRKAVQYVMGDAKPKEDVTGLGDTEKGDKVREDRKQQARSKTVDTINRQPPSVSSAGKSNTSASVSHIRSIKDLEKVSEDELAKLRGDTM